MEIVVLLFYRMTIFLEVTTNNSTTKQLNNLPTLLHKNENKAMDLLILWFLWMNVKIYYYICNLKFELDIVVL